MEQNMIYKTSASRLMRLIEHDNSDIFKFVFRFESQESDQSRKQFEINTTLNKARVISKNVNNICLIDPTINEYEIFFSSKNNFFKEGSEKVIKLIEKLIKSIHSEVHINQEEIYSFNQLLLHLGEENEQMSNKMICSIEEAVSFLSTEFHDHSIIYLSSHLKEFLTETRIKSISIEIINEVIDAFFNNKKNSEKNSNDDELDQIFTELKQKEESDSIIMHFLTQIAPEEMSSNMIDYFYDHLDDEIISNEMSNIIFILKHHISTFIEHISKKKKIIIEKQIEFEGNELKGINDYLLKKTDGNINDALKLYGGGKICPSRPLMNLIKYSSDHINDFYFNYYHVEKVTKNDGWIEFDYCKRKINLKSYTIRSNKDDASSWYHPKSWTIVGSNDRKNWDVLDQQIDNSKLNGNYKQYRFECSENNNYYEYIRFIQSDNWFVEEDRNYNIYLTCIEFFGSISICNDD